MLEVFIAAVRLDLVELLRPGISLAHFWHSYLGFLYVCPFHILKEFVLLHLLDRQSFLTLSNDKSSDKRLRTSRKLDGFILVDGYRALHIVIRNF